MLCWWLQYPCDWAHRDLMWWGTRDFTDISHAILFPPLMWCQGGPLPSSLTWQLCEKGLFAMFQTIHVTCFAPVWVSFLEKQHTGQWSSWHFPDDGQTHIGTQELTQTKHWCERHTKGRHKPHQVLTSGQVTIFCKWNSGKPKCGQSTVHKTQSKLWTQCCATYQTQMLWITFNFMVPYPDVTLWTVSEPIHTHLNIPLNQSKPVFWWHNRWA